MIKSDKELLWRPGRIYIPAWQFAGLDYETTTATDIKSIGVGSGNDLAVAEVNTSSVTGVTFGSNADTLEHFMVVPHWDRRFPIYFRVWWTANNTSGNVTWDVLYKTYIPGSTVIGSAAATTALDVTPGAHTMASVAYTVMRTPEGYIKGSTLADTCEAIQLSVKRTAATTITSAIFLGLEIRFTPRFLQGQGMLVAAKPSITIGSDKYQ